MNRQVFSYLVPYWRRLVLVLAISLISTATTLVHSRLLAVPG